MSSLKALEPLYTLLPEIRTPEKKIAFTNRLYWTLGVLVVFLVMGQIELIGIEPTQAAALEQLQVLLASEIGTLITVGIGPIVLASIILQLLVGAQFIQVDLSKPEERAEFQGAQKLLAILLSFFEAGIFVLSGTLAPQPGMLMWVLLQVAIGSIILLYLDEIVSKYGIGSGISLFIAAGVSSSFFWRVLRLPGTGGLTDPGGNLFQVFGAGGFTIVPLIPIAVAILIFVIIVFVEGIHVNIPITLGGSGIGGRYPVKLMYVSNMPVILAVALFANIHLWNQIASSHSIPILTDLLGGLTWATTSPFGLMETVIVRVLSEGGGALVFLAPQLLQALVYTLALVICCVVFGIFWVNMGNQGPEAVAEQLEKSGMYIKGFRRDKRVIQQILERYIPTITILGSIFVGILAAFGDMALSGLSSGTGILLTVGIVYRMYEDIAKQQASESNAILAKLMGG